MATDLDLSRGKDLITLHPIAARRIHQTLDRFSETGHADIRRLVNVKPPTRRIRTGHHRIVLELRKHPNEAYILRIKPRDSAYQCPDYEVRIAMIELARVRGFSGRST